MRWNRKRFEADAEDARSRGAGGIYIILKDGEKVVGRFMPVSRPKPNEEAELYIRYGQHYLKEFELYLVCLKELIVADFVPKGWGGCPYCGMWKELRGSKDADDQEEAKKYGMSVRFMSNFRKAEGAMGIFRYNTKTQPKLIDLAFGTEWSDILDLKDGRDVEVRRKGASIDTEYSITPLKATSTIPDAALNDLHDLYAEVKVLPPERMMAVLKGEDVEDDEYITLRDLMTAKAAMSGAKFDAADVDELRQAVKPGASTRAARAASPVKTEAPGSGAVARRRRDEPAAEPDEGGAEDADRKPTKAEGKQLLVFAKELDLEIDLDGGYSYRQIVDALMTEAIGVKTKGMSEDLGAFLEANGCDVDGKVVAKAEAEAQPEPEAEAEKSEGLSEVEKQIQRVRDARARKK